jgi:hypothetical protein
MIYQTVPGWLDSPWWYVEATWCNPPDLSAAKERNPLFTEMASSTYFVPSPNSSTPSYPNLMLVWSKCNATDWWLTPGFSDIGPKICWLCVPLGPYMISLVYPYYIPSSPIHQKILYPPWYHHVSWWMLKSQRNCHFSLGYRIQDTCWRVHHRLQDICWIGLDWRRTSTCSSPKWSS